MPVPCNMNTKQNQKSTKFVLQHVERRREDLIVEQHNKQVSCMFVVGRVLFVSYVLYKIYILQSVPLHTKY